MLENGGNAIVRDGTDGDSTANERGLADHGLTTEPNVAELAKMPPHIRNFRLKYWKGPPVDADELEAAVAAAVQREFEVIAGKAASRKVYFIQCETGPIKIGVASNPAARLRTLQTANPHSLTILLTVDAGAMFEAKMHQKFREHWIRGEWFNPHPDILAEIERLRGVVA